MSNNSAETEMKFGESLQYPLCNDFTKSSFDPAFYVGFGS